MKPGQGSKELLQVSAAGIDSMKKIESTGFFYLFDQAEIIIKTIYILCLPRAYRAFPGRKEK
jgi:hypothetical protein